MSELKPTDIRIGNLVWENYSGEMVVVSIDFDGTIDLCKRMDLPKGVYQLKNIEPVILTETWLNKLGFEVSNRLDNAWTDKNVGFPIWWNDETDSAYHINSETLVHLDYVHQLQNLFFANCGEELTVIP